MKLVIKERGSKDYYNEFLYVAFNYKKILNNPNKKAKKITNSLLLYGLFIILSILLFIYFYKTDNSKLYLVFIGMFIFILLADIFMLFFSCNRIKEYMNEKGSKTINIEKDFISYKDNNKSFRVDFDDLKYVVINKYSICFIPKNKLSALISVNIEHKKDVIDAFLKYKKDYLIVDNNGSDKK